MLWQRTTGSYWQQCRKLQLLKYSVTFTIKWYKTPNQSISQSVYSPVNRGVVVNFDLGERFPRPYRSQQRESLRPRARSVAVLGVGAGGVAPPAEGVRGCHPLKFFWDFWCQIPRLGQFGPENKLIEGQPNEYDVICRNASVLAFYLWPTIFPGAPFWLQNICRNGVPLRFRTTTPLLKTYFCQPYFCTIRAHRDSGSGCLALSLLEHVARAEHLFSLFFLEYSMLLTLILFTFALYYIIISHKKSFVAYCLWFMLVYT